MGSAPDIEIYDRRLLALHRDRAARMRSADRFLLRHVEQEFVDRLDFVQRPFRHALVVGAADSALPDMLRARGMTVECTDSGMAFSQQNGGDPVDPDRIAMLPGGYDLVLIPGGLDLVNDLPGMLVQCRRLMVPDAMIMGALAGAGSLPVLRQLLQTAEAADGDGVSPRLHPQIDVRAAGDLIGRAGFAEPVADGHGLTVKYRSLSALVQDLRAHGAGNALNRRSLRPFSRAAWLAAQAGFAALRDDHGQVAERMEVIVVTGWTASLKPA
jgi:hypothetical protein